MSTMSEYKSGVCNIDAEEVEKRRYGSYVMFLIVAAFIGIIFYYPQSGTGFYTYTSLFGVSTAAFIMYLQSRNSFCTGLALRGKENTSDNVEKVGKSEEVWKDRKKALLMFVESIMLSAGLTGLVYMTVNYVGFLPILG